MILRLKPIRQGLRLIARVLTQLLTRGTNAEKKGALQNLSATLKIVWTLCWVVAVSLVQNVLWQFGAFALLLILSFFNPTGFRKWLMSVLTLAFFFGFLVMLPATTNVFVNGKMILPFLSFSHEHTWGPYHLPAQIGVTLEGIKALTVMCLRILNSTGCVLLLLSTTPLSKIMTTLERAKIPSLWTQIVFLTYKFIFNLSRNAEEMHRAKLARQCREMSRKESQQFLTQSLGVLWRKLMKRSQATHQALQARGQV